MKSLTAAPVRSSSGLDLVQEGGGSGASGGSTPGAVHQQSGSFSVGGNNNSKDVTTPNGTRKTISVSNDGVNAETWNKDLKARIAKVHEEQRKFRSSEKLKAIKHLRESVTFKDSVKEEKMLKRKKSNRGGAVLGYNTFSIRAGLRKRDYRETIEESGAIQRLQNQRRIMDELSVNSNIIGSAFSLVEAAEKERLYNEECEKNVTVKGEGYMSEDDWRITSIESNKKPFAASSREPSTRKLLQIQKNTVAAHSQLNLEQFIETTLREQTTKRVNISDSDKTAHVSLSFLQSANLIEKRFGWEAKDHSLAAPVGPARYKSWRAIRAAVHSTGTFNMIAAAAAAPSMIEMPTYSKSGRELPPPERPPVIVLEAAPVTDFVHHLIEQKHKMQQMQMRAASAQLVEGNSNSMSDSYESDSGAGKYNHNHHHHDVPLSSASADSAATASLSPPHSPNRANTTTAGGAGGGGGCNGSGDETTPNSSPSRVQKLAFVISKIPPIHAPPPQPQQQQPLHGMHGHGGDHNSNHNNNN